MDLRLLIENNSGKSTNNRGCRPLVKSLGGSKSCKDRLYGSLQRRARVNAQANQEPYEQASGNVQAEIRAKDSSLDHGLELGVEPEIQIDELDQAEQQSGCPAQECIVPQRA